MGQDDFSINTDRKRFELNIDDLISFVDYRINDDGAYQLTHTEVAEDLKGRGVGTELVDRTLGYLKDNGLKVVPGCSFVHKYMMKYPETHVLLSDGGTL